MNFIGRGEKRVQDILQLLFPKAVIRSQVPIKEICDVAELGAEYNKHKFDLVVHRRDAYVDLVVEVNYKHGKIAREKWSNVYKEHIISAKKIPVTVEDYECPSIFDTPRERALRWHDYIEVINSLKSAGVSP